MAFITEHPVCTTYNIFYILHIPAMDIERLHPLIGWGEQGQNKRGFRLKSKLVPGRKLKVCLIKPNTELLKMYGSEVMKTSICHGWLFCHCFQLWAYFLTALSVLSSRKATAAWVAWKVLGWVSFSLLHSRCQFWWYNDTFSYGGPCCDSIKIIQSKWEIFLDTES